MQLSANFIGHSVDAVALCCRWNLALREKQLPAVLDVSGSFHDGLVLVASGSEGSLLPAP